MFKSPVAKGDLVAGKYRVRKVLGQGGMGVVVEAVDVDLDRPVAIKFLLANHLEDEQAYERFRREARATARIDNQHAVRVYDTGRHKHGEPFIVMERLVGSDLAQRLQAGPLSTETAVSYVLQTCEGLAAAHAQGIVHRDVKPGNLFIEQRADGTEQLKILDFGLAKPIGSDTLTGSNHILGSPTYMSPEQLGAPGNIDARSDIWALGVVLYEVLAGHRPFEGGALLEICAKILHAQPEPPSALNEAVPPELDAVVMRCLARERDERYADIGELAVALEPFAASAAKGAAQRVNRTLAAEPLPAIADADADHSSISSASVKPWTTGERVGPAWGRWGLGGLSVAAFVAVGAWLASHGDPADEGSELDSTAQGGGPASAAALAIGETLPSAVVGVPPAASSSVSAAVSAVPSVSASVTPPKSKPSSPSPRRKTATSPPAPTAPRATPQRPVALPAKPPSDPYESRQ